MENKVKIGIVLGSTQEGRLSPQVGNWLKTIGDKRNDAVYEIIDIKEYNLPMYGERIDEAVSKKWQDKLNSLDGFIFAISEYNHSISAALKNAIDHAYKPWSNKAAGIVSYGYAGGARAAEHLRGILGAIAVADVQAHLLLSMFTDFDKELNFKPQDHHQKTLTTLFDQVLMWSTALKTVRK
jgi:NAD(P)H-dependent FMN reductase